MLSYAIAVPLATYDTRFRKLGGGHEQIRTADLPLRRRLLYPSELRARAKGTFIVVPQAFLANVAPEVHAFETDSPDTLIGA